MIRSWISRQRQQVISRVGSRPVNIGPGRIVSFCFDDFPRSALTAGGAILRAHGVRGTYYTALGLMDTHNDLGEQFHRHDLDTVLVDGHELGCHTFHHLSCRSVAASAFEADVWMGRDRLQELLGYDPVNFAYPYGHVKTSVKGRIGKRMTSCRGIFAGVNGPVADLNLLRANSLYGDETQLEGARRLLRNCADDSQWLIFYTHDVCERPSPYGCTPALLEETVKEALRQGFTIQPIAQAVGLPVQSRTVAAASC